MKLRALVSLLGVWLVSLSTAEEQANQNFVPGVFIPAQVFQNLQQNQKNTDNTKFNNNSGNQLTPNQDPALKINDPKPLSDSTSPSMSQETQQVNGQPQPSQTLNVQPASQQSYYQPNVQPAIMSQQTVSQPMVTQQQIPASQLPLSQQSNLQQPIMSHQASQPMIIQQPLTQQSVQPMVTQQLVSQPMVQQPVLSQQIQSQQPMTNQQAVVGQPNTQQSFLLTQPNQQAVLIGQPNTQQVLVSQQPTYNQGSAFVLQPGQIAQVSQPIYTDQGLKPVQNSGSTLYAVVPVNQVSTNPIYSVNTGK